MALKGVAVSQIILLVLGIIVLAVVAYLLYTNFLSSNSSFDQNKCNAEKLAACTRAKIAGQIDPVTGQINGFSPSETPSCGGITTLNCNTVLPDSGTSSDCGTPDNPCK